MGNIIRFECGKSYTHFDVQAYFKLETSRKAKEWIAENNVLYIPENKGAIWTMIGDHILAAMAVSARTHKDWQEDREERRRVKENEC